MNRIKVLGVVYYLLFVSNFPSNSHASEVGDALQLLSYRVTAATKPDVTDGLIAPSTDPTDWTSAYVRWMTVAVNGITSNDTRLVSFLVSNDSDNLYIGVAAQLPNASELNRLTLYFDQSTRGVLDGSGGSPGEYYVTMRANGSAPQDGHWDGSNWTANVTTLATGFGRRAGSGGNHVYNFELQIPLKSAADASNSYLNLTAGDEVGMLLMITLNTGETYFWEHTNATTTNPSATGVNGKTGWGEIQTIGRGVADRDLVSLYAKDIVPTVDGVIANDNNWRYAFDKDIVFTDFDGNKLDGSLKIKEHDSPNSLIFGVTVENTAPAAADYLALYFDQGANGGPLNYILTDGGDPKSDHASRMLGNGTYQDYYFNTTDWVADAGSHGSGAAGSSGGNWEVELNMPLSSGDVNDLDIASGDIVGLLIKFYDSGNNRNYWWSATINTEEIQMDPDAPVYNALGWGRLQTGGPFIQTIYPEVGDTLSGEYPLAIYTIDPSDPTPETGIESVTYEVRKEDQATGAVTTLLSGSMSKIEDNDLAIWTGTLNTRGISESADTPLVLVYKVYDGEIDTVAIPIDIYVNNQGGSTTVDDPKLSISTPVPNAVLSGSGINIGFSASTPSPLTLDTVRVYIDGNLMQTYYPSGTSTYSNTYSWNTTPYADGEHIIQIWAVNSLGIENFSPTVLVITQNAPTVTITSPAPSDLLRGLVNVTFNAIPVTPSTLTLTEISIDGGTWAAVTTQPPAVGGAGSHSLNTALLVDGSHSIRIRSTDNTGKMGYSILIQVSVDNTPPTGSLTANPGTVKDGDAATFIYDGGETGLTVVIPVAQLNNLDDQAASDLNLTDGNNDGIYTAIHTVDNGNSVSDGAKTLTATVTDGANNTYNPQVTITLDNTAPVFVSLVGLDPDLNYTNGETIVLLATFDASGYTVTCDFSPIDSDYITGSEDIADNGDGTYTIRYILSMGNSRANGSYAVRATAEDDVGLTGSGTINLYLDNTGPVVSNLALADADDVLNANDVITATVTDNDANIQGAEFFIDVIGAPTEGTSLTASDGSFDSQSEGITAVLSIVGLSEGQHTLYVRGRDVTGKWGQVVSIRFVVDRLPPLISSVEVNYPPGQSAARNSQNVTITAQILEVTTQLDLTTVLLRAANVDANSAAGYVMVDDGTGGDRVAGDGIYTGVLTVTSNSTGSFAFTIDASDIVPNNRQITGSVVLDNTAPVFVSLVCLDPDNIYTNGETILLRATFDAAGYTVTCDFSTMDTAYVQGSESVEDNGDGTYTIRYTLSETNSRPNGSYTVQTVATDGVGLTASGTILLYLDNTGPVVSNLALADQDDILNANDVITATVTDNDANIQNAEFFVDVIGNPGEGQSMTASDGSFDFQSEGITAVLSIGSLSEGQHTLYVRGQDVTGKWGPVSSLTFIIDRVSPSIEIVQITYPEGQNAARNGQNIVIRALIREATTQLDPTTILLRAANVDANSAAGYVMVDDGTGGDRVAGDGIYTAVLTVTSNSTGSFAFTIDASDIVPNNRQITGSVVLDNTAPVFVSLVCLDPDTIYANGETILLQARFDVAGYIVTCDFSAMDSAYVIGAEDVEDNGDGTYTIRYTLSEGNPRPNGSYTITTVATDGVGLTANGTINLYLDNSGPVVTNLALADADDILNADDVITATVTDNDANILKAEFFVDVIGTPGEGSPLTPTDGNFDSLSENVTAVLSITNLSEGQHTLFVRGQDVTGKWGQVTSLIFIVDRLPPTIESVLVVYPDNQAAARNGQNIVISALIKEATTRLDSTTIRLRAANVDSNSAVGYVMVDDGSDGDLIAGDGIFTAMLNVTSDSTGSFDFTITASDIVPNTSQVGGSVVLDNTPPVFVSLVCLDPDRIYRNGETILLRATFDASEYVVTANFISIDAAYVESAEHVENRGDNTYTIRFTISETNLRPNGNYSVTATATDGVGLRASGSILLQLVNTGPVVTDLALADADDILNTDDVITAIVMDSDAAIQRAEYYIDVIGIPGEGTAMMPVDGSFNSMSESVTATLPITELSEGQHTLYVRGRNVSGEWGRLTSLIFIVDRLPPTIETVEIRYPEGQHAAKRSQIVVISALIKEATTRLDSMSIRLKAVNVDINSQVGYVMMDDGTFGDRIPGDGIFTATLTVTSANTGTFGFTIEASDIVPNHHQIGGSILLDNIPPVMTAAYFPIPDNGEVYVNEVRVTCSYYDLPDSGEVKNIELIVANTESNDINTSPIVIPPDDPGSFSRIIHLVPGENTITIVITDYAGNVTRNTTVLTYLHPIHTQEIDAGGGLVQSSDSTTIDIPSNALLREETITISVISTKELPRPLDGITLLEFAHAFGPDGLIFHRPVTIQLTYNDAHLDVDQDGQPDFQEAGLDVFYLDGSVWIKTRAEDRDVDNNTVTFTTNHFSVYALGTADATDGFQMYWTKNPFKPEEGTTAVIQITEPGRISLKVYDLSGDLIRTISDNESVDGTTSRRWDGLNDFDRYVGSGIYIYLFEYKPEEGSKQIVRKPIGVVK